MSRRRIPSTKKEPSTKNKPSASPQREPAGAISVSDPHRKRVKRDPLLGRFFHSFHPENKYPDAPTRIVRWQGRVLGRTDAHSYLIELYSWDDGLPNGQQLQSVAGMENWKFYSTAHDMNGWYEDTYRPIVKRYDFGADA